MRIICANWSGTRDGVQVRIDAILFARGFRDLAAAPPFYAGVTTELGIQQVWKLVSTSMQPISPPAATASPSDILIAFAISQVVAIIIIWLTSLLVARSHATWKNALIAYVKGFISVLIVIVVAVIGVLAAGHFGADPLIPGVIAICAAVSILVVAIAVPMNVYDLTAGPGIGFVVIQLVFNLAAGFLLEPFKPANIAFPKGVELPAILKRAETKAKVAPPAPGQSAAALKARREELNRRGQLLATRKQYMPKYDPTALAAYERDKAVYDRDVAALKADEAAAALEK
jgi:hypothetical protein